MPKIEKVMLLDTRQLIVRKGVEFEEYEHYERQPAFEIGGDDIALVGRIFNLTTHHKFKRSSPTGDSRPMMLTADDVKLRFYPGKFSKWSPADIEGEVDNGTLNLVLTWGEGEPERISYNGKFMVWWAE